MSTDEQCPHCGAINFAEAAYCKRCHRPLKVAQKAERRDSHHGTLHGALPMAPQPLAAASQRPPDPPQKPTIEAERPFDRVAGTSRRPRESRSGAEVIAPARAWRVLLGLLIDLGFIAAVAIGVGAAELTLRNQWSFRPLARGLPDAIAEWVFLHPDVLLHAAVVAWALGFLLGVWPGAPTLGRLVTGTVLVRSSGRPFTFWVVLLRAVGLLFTSATAGLGFVWALFDPHRRSWHDLLAGTVTVRRRDVR
ncbi:MAG: RDD family protein [Myxococcota bacterium]